MTCGEHDGLTEKTEKMKGFMSFVSLVKFSGMSIRGENSVPGDEVSVRRYVEQFTCGRKRGAFRVHGDEVVG